MDNERPPVAPHPKQHLGSKKLTDALARHAANIEELQQTLRKANAEGVIAIGRELHAARERLGNHGNGGFGRWCREQLTGISARTAQKWIRVYEEFGDCASLAQSFDLTALYELSKSGVPRAAIDEALAIAKSGPVHCDDAKRLIENANQSPVPFDTADVEAPPPAARPTPLDRLKKWWEKATDKERREFKEWTKTRVVKTEIDTETGRRMQVAS